MEQIKDDKGNIPTWVIHNKKLIHQPSGLSEPLLNGTDDHEVGLAVDKIKAKLEQLP